MGNYGCMNTFVQAVYIKQGHRRRTRGAGVDRAPLDSKMAHRHNKKFRAEPPGAPKLISESSVPLSRF